jgi:hypothetical protein
VQDPFVVVRWNFPLPNQSYCSDPMPASVARELQGMLSEQVPLARFTCERMLLTLGGQAQLVQGPITWELTYHAAVVLKRI